MLTLCKIYSPDNLPCLATGNIFESESNNAFSRVFVTLIKYLLVRVKIQTTRNRSLFCCLGHESHVSTIVLRRLSFICTSRKILTGRMTTYPDKCPV